VDPYLQQLAAGLSQQYKAPNTWQQLASLAPRVGGSGATPPLPTWHASTPLNRAESESPVAALSDDPAQNSSPQLAGGGMTPPDSLASGKTPYVISQIPDRPLPNSAARGFVPIPSGGSALGGPAMPIPNVTDENMMHPATPPPNDMPMNSVIPDFYQGQQMMPFSGAPFGFGSMGG
jgi:hypothetical protein